MSRVTILGAGDMGTALVTPLSDNHHEIRLWGTERDSGIIAALRDGAPHPRLGIPLPEQVSAYFASEAESALGDADLVVVAITSDAVRSVLSSLGNLLSQCHAIVTVAKGFDVGADGAIKLLPETISELVPAPVIAVGGPSKANEVAHGQPTAVVFGGIDADSRSRSRDIFTTSSYRVAETDDVVGLEIAAAMKNAYAIALGIPDGLEKRTGKPHHNLRAALFPQAVSEMSALAVALGGREETIRSLAGAGDLQVTVTSGRNRLLGERIGSGESPLSAVEALTALGTTIEGYLAADYGFRLFRSAVDRNVLEDGCLPLLSALWRILYGDAPPSDALRSALR